MREDLTWYSFHQVKKACWANAVQMVPYFREIWELKIKDSPWHHCEGLASCCLSPWSLNCCWTASLSAVFQARTRVKNVVLETDFAFVPAAKKNINLIIVVWNPDLLPHSGFSFQMEVRASGWVYRLILAWYLMEEYAFGRGPFPASSNLGNTQQSFTRVCHVHHVFKTRNTSQTLFRVHRVPLCVQFVSFDSWVLDLEADIIRNKLVW